MTVIEAMKKKLPILATYDKFPEGLEARARSLCFEFNHLPPEKHEHSMEILKELFGTWNPKICIHPEQRLMFDDAKPINIGENVWIGANATVLSGVTIGKNSVIGAGSVVTKDIPENVVAVGNPCRVLRPITEADKKTPQEYD